MTSSNQLRVMVSWRFSTARATAVHAARSAGGKSVGTGRVPVASGARAEGSSAS
jgi:hypothetical protein